MCLYLPKRQEVISHSGVLQQLQWTHTYNSWLFTTWMLCFWQYSNAIRVILFIYWVHSAGSFSSCHLPSPPLLLPSWPSICPLLFVEPSPFQTICGFIIHTPSCNTKRSRKKKRRLPMSILLGLYSGLSLEHKGCCEALNAGTLSSTDVSKFCLFFIFFLSSFSRTVCS